MRVAPPMYAGLGLAAGPVAVVPVEEVEAELAGDVGAGALGGAEALLRVGEEDGARQVGVVGALAWGEVKGAAADEIAQAGGVLWYLCQLLSRLLNAWEVVL